MRTHNILPCYRKIKEILIMRPDLALLPTLIGSNYSCLELIFMVPKVFEPLKFDCIWLVLCVFFSLSLSIQHAHIVLTKSMQYYDIGHIRKS